MRPLPILLSLVCAVPILGDVVSAQRTHDVALTARPGAVEIAPGQRVGAWLYNGALPGPTIRVTEGDTVRVTLRNELPEDTTIHWHGLPVPLRVDGVPGVSQGPIGVGQEYRYEFTASTPGSYWYHPHFDLQIDRGLVAPLIVEPRDRFADPPHDVEHLVVLDDWLPGAPVPGRDPAYSDFLLNGRTSRGQRPMAVARGQTARLRLINTSGATSYVVTVDGHPMRVTHTDGQPVRPVTTRAIPIAPGERYDVYIAANNPGKWSVAAAALENRGVTLVRGVLAYRGSTAPNPPPSYVPPDLRNAPLLSYSQLASLAPSPLRSPDRQHALTLGWRGMMSYVWTINGQAWPNVSPIDVATGETVQFDMFNMSPHAHPMHLHGHFFRVVGSAGGSTHALVKDTILVPGHMGRASFQFAADNPGSWPFHCHHIYHMGAGMMRLVRYAGTDADRDGVPDGDDYDPTGAYPIPWVTDGGGGYRPGTTVTAHAQWQPNERLSWFLGPELARPLSLGALGRVGIDPLLGIGSTTVGSDREGRLALAVPNDPRLSGARVALQAVTTHATLPPGLRLSRWSLLRVR